MEKERKACTGYFQLTVVSDFKQIEKEFEKTEQGQQRMKFLEYLWFLAFENEIPTDFSLASLFSAHKNKEGKSSTRRVLILRKFVNCTMLTFRFFLSMYSICSRSNVECERKNNIPQLLTRISFLEIMSRFF